MVQTNISTEVPEVPPLDEESVFRADYEKQWDFEGKAKDKLIFELLRPRFKLAKYMKNSADSTLAVVDQFMVGIKRLFT